MLGYTQFHIMKNIFGITALLLACFASLIAQTPAKSQPQFSGDITGLYSFVHEGEFVQIEVNEGKVSGLVSRFKGEDPDKAEFLDQFFDQAQLDGNTLSFRTKEADGTWFEFTGDVERGPAKTPSDEGYWLIKGTLIERHKTAEGKNTDKVHDLTLKSFPEDTEPSAARGKDSHGTATPVPAK
jgi:hypothetical protein